MAEQGVGRPLSPAEVDRYWSSRAWSWIRDHPGDWLTLLRRKFTVLWNQYEIPDNYHFGFMREHFLTTLALGVTLGVVGPLAIVGMVLPFWRRRGLVAFNAIWLAYMVTPLLYYVRGRYRLPLAPFLALLAGVGAERLYRAWQAKRWDQLGTLAAVLLAGTIFVDHRYCEPPHHGFGALCFADDIWYDQEWMKLAGHAQERGDLDGAIAALERAAECTVPRGVGQMTFWRGDVERQKPEARAGGDRAARLQHLRRARDAFLPPADPLSARRDDLPSSAHRGAPGRSFAGATVRGQARHHSRRPPRGTSRASSPAAAKSAPSPSRLHDASDGPGSVVHRTRRALRRSVVGPDGVLGRRRPRRYAGSRAAAERETLEEVGVDLSGAEFLVVGWATSTPVNDWSRRSCCRRSVLRAARAQRRPCRTTRCANVLGAGTAARRSGVPGAASLGE